MSDLFYRNRRLLVLTVALILVAGISAYQSLPRLEDPELISRNSIVITSFPVPSIASRAFLSRLQHT